MLRGFRRTSHTVAGVFCQESSGNGVGYRLESSVLMFASMLSLSTNPPM